MGDKIPGALTLDAIEQTALRLSQHVTRTPSIHVIGRPTPGSRLSIKLEMLQDTGSFKFRGAMNNLLSLDPDQAKRGVVTVSSGNHGIALSEAGRRLHIPVTIVLGKGANPYRRGQMRARGARITVASSVHEAFEVADGLAQSEGLTFVHPYDGVRTIAATATLGLEMIEDCRAAGPNLDAVVLPVGGGGLAAGVALAFKLRSPETAIYAAEPAGAPTLSMALAQKRPVTIHDIKTIADSLGAPIMGGESFRLCNQFMSDAVTVDEDEIRAALRLIFEDFRQYVEPASAVTLAAILGPLSSRLQGKTVGTMFCGANIDVADFAALVAGPSEAGSTGSA